MASYYVYILASKSRRLYVGVTNNLERRLFEHKNKLVDGFTSQYNIDRLVHFEDTEDVLSAIAREKQIKGWTRAKKAALIEADNPAWDDLSESWQQADSSLRSQERKCKSLIKRVRFEALERAQGIFLAPKVLARFRPRRGVDHSE